MTKSLSGKTAFVTAAGQGIGRAIAERLCAEGASVIASDINADSLAGLSTSQVLALDVTDEHAVFDAARAYPMVDVLVNAAGYVHSGTVLECEQDAWHSSFRINVDSMYYTIKAFLPNMIRLGRGTIINISSVASSIKGVPNRFAYTATKAAVIGLTKSVAADFVKQKIRCNAICPGTVDSPSLHERLRATGDYDGAMAAFKDRQPMGRLGRPEEIAAMATYLASDEAAFVTGQAFVIDGGWSN